MKKRVGCLGVIILVIVLSIVYFDVIKASFNKVSDGFHDFFVEIGVRPSYEDLQCNGNLTQWPYSDSSGNKGTQTSAFVWVTNPTNYKIKYKLEIVIYMNGAEPYKEVKTLTIEPGKNYGYSKTMIHYEGEGTPHHIKATIYPPK